MAQQAATTKQRAAAKPAKDTSSTTKPAKAQAAQAKTKPATPTKPVDLDLTVLVDGRDVGIRDLVDEEVVQEYAEAMERGAKFPPIVVFLDPKTKEYYQASGKHRRRAVLKLGLTRIKAEVRSGGRREAQLYAASENITHGVRRTNLEKRMAVEVLLSDPEWRKWTEGKIAKHVGVSQQLVSKIINEHKDRNTYHNGKSEDGPDDDDVRLAADGRPMHTGKIGRQRKATPIQGLRRVATPESTEAELEDDGVTPLVAGPVDVPEMPLATTTSEPPEPATPEEVEAWSARQGERQARLQRERLADPVRDLLTLAAPLPLPEEIERGIAAWVEVYAEELRKGLEDAGWAEERIAIARARVQWYGRLIDQIEAAWQASRRVGTTEAEAESEVGADDC